jgi:hypothetical protein
MLDRIQVASPCSENWNLMKGDDQVRFCAHCSKHVYNLSAMTLGDAEVLLRESGGSVCTRFYRRADGTILTQDCPVGMRAKTDRLRRRVSLAMSGVLGLVPAFAQSPNPPGASQTQPQQGASVRGVVRDPAGGFIPQALVSLFNETTGVRIAQARTNAQGEYQLTGVEPGTYTLRAEMPGFISFTQPHFVIEKNATEKRDLRMEIPITMGATIVDGTGGAQPVMSEPARHLK